jgi:pyruvate kinase
MALLHAGVDVARLNFSHGSHADHAETIRRLRLASRELGRPVTILQDLQGPKIRVGELRGGQVELHPGDPLALLPFEALGDERAVSVDFPELTEAVEPGGRILMDDGNIELSVIATSPDRVETRVKVGGVLKANKGVNLPHARLHINAMTEKDQEDLAFGMELEVDAVAISFVHTAEDVQRVRQAVTRLAPERSGVPLIAKLERPEALDNLEAIVDAADGVMVARGDLGVEMAPETVPIAQKRIIRLANERAKIVITATQMLESMMYSPRPTRAEASDVANAIFDGTDAVMLSGETAAGLYPVQAVTMMDAIVRQAEEHSPELGRWGGVPDPGACEDDVYYTARAADALARDRNVAALATFTESGRTARVLSKYRPQTAILAFTPYEETYNRLNLIWGLRPYLIARAESIEEMTEIVNRAMLESTTIQPGQQVVLVCGYPVSDGRPANLALLHTVKTD